MWLIFIQLPLLGLSSQPMLPLGHIAADGLPRLIRSGLGWAFIADELHVRGGCRQGRRVGGVGQGCTLLCHSPGVHTPPNSPNLVPSWVRLGVNCRKRVSAAISVFPQQKIERREGSTTAAQADGYSPTILTLRDRLLPAARPLASCMDPSSCLRTGCTLRKKDQRLNRLDPPSCIRSYKNCLYVLPIEVHPLPCRRIDFGLRDIHVQPLDNSCKRYLSEIRHEPTALIVQPSKQPTTSVSILAPGAACHSHRPRMGDIAAWRGDHSLCTYTESELISSTTTSRGSLA